MYGGDNSTLFAIKALMKTEPNRLIFSLLIFTIFVFGNSVRICEAPLDRIDGETMLHNYANSVWEVIITMTTVGFGDMFPRTIFGRIFMILCALNGVVIVSIMVLTVMNNFEFEPLENRAFIVTSKVSKRKELKNTSSKIIQEFFRIIKNKKKGQGPTENQIVKVKAGIKELKSTMNAYRSLKEPNLLDTISSEFENVGNTQKEMLLYVGMIGKMLVAREYSNIESVLSKDEKTFVNVILNLLDRPDIAKIKEQHENVVKAKKVSSALDLKGVLNLLGAADNIDANSLKSFGLSEVLQNPMPSVIPEEPNESGLPGPQGGGLSSFNQNPYFDQMDEFMEVRDKNKGSEANSPNNHHIHERNHSNSGEKLDDIDINML